MSIVFLGFEASSLCVGSLPIEVGWAPVDGGVQAYLIYPAVGRTEWSPASQPVHGVTQVDLALNGRSVAETTVRVLEVLTAPGAIVASDQLQWEQLWLDRLMQSTGISDLGIVILDAEQVYAAEGDWLL